MAEPTLRKIVYFHGGPGFNARPEQALLTAPFRAAGLELVAWHEPSRLRPQGPPFRSRGAFQNYLDQAEAFFLANAGPAPVVLMGHSFGSHAVAHIASGHARRVAQVVLVAPALSLSDADRNMLEIARADYEAHGDERHRALGTTLREYDGVFDDRLVRAFALVAENPRFFSYYWRDRERMARFLAHYVGPYAIDPEAFFAVRMSMRGWSPGFLPSPCAVAFGAHDVVISKAAEEAVLRAACPSVAIREFAGSGHYPHVEETEGFLAWLAPLRDGTAPTREQSTETRQ